MGTPATALEAGSECKIVILHSVAETHATVASETGLLSSAMSKPA
jgi:hypothetical protein